MNNSYLEETSNGINEFAVRSRLLTERKIFICGQITPETAVNFIQSMMYLIRSSEPISIYINSVGGDVNAGLAIYDIIQGCKNELRAYCIGQAFSMAAVILAGCQKWRRFILPHSQVMVHEAMLGGEFGGTAVSVRNLAERLNDTQKQLNDILSRHTGRSLEDIIRDVSFDNFLSAERAVALGFCDKVINNIWEE